jgi:two-component system chemotaxis response regulator CheB
VIGIVAATGGPQALVEILGGLPRELALPILIVMSMPPDFLKGWVAWLDERCLLKVTAAEDGDVPEPGHVYVASGDPRLVIVQGYLRLQPSGSDLQPKNMLFHSMARDLGPGAVAVILTGMGSDGAEGMKAVRDAGGYTIAQDEATSIVYGTPRSAVKIDAACESLPLKEIAPRLLALAAAGPAGLK